MSRKSLGGPVTAQAGPPPEPSEPAIELENQFILRLPEEPAAALREALRSGAGNIKERLSIQLQPDGQSPDPRLRKGIVEFDGWNMHAKLIDMPAIIESHKTIDRKSFYKSADICQMLICKEGEPSDEDEPVPANTAKKFDPNKVEKKNCYPHGICPPLKNCRKRRFRKTLRKKYIDAPENEKEVKCLFRNDLEAIRVKWEVMTEDQVNLEKGVAVGAEPPAKKAEKDAKNETSTAVDEAELFGAALSDSDDEGRDQSATGNVDIDSEGDSSTTFGQKNFLPAAGHSQSAALPELPGGGPTEFSAEMFHKGDDAAAPDSTQPEDQGNAVALKMQRINSEIDQLKRQKRELENNVANCENLALLQKFKTSLASLEEELLERMEELEAFSMFN